jgi:hypothetical protein
MDERGERRPQPRVVAVPPLLLDPSPAVILLLHKAVPA